MATTLSSILKKRREMEGYQPRYDRTGDTAHWDGEDSGEDKEYSLVRNLIKKKEDNSLQGRKKSIESRRKLIEGYKKRHQTTGRTTAQADLLRADREAAAKTYTEVRNKSGMDTPGEGYIRYDRMAGQKDYSDMVQAGKEKANVFNSSYGLIDYLDIFNKDKQAVLEASNYNFTRMTDTEKDLYYYINGKYGAEAATDYIEKLNRDLNRRNAEAVSQSAEEIGKEHPIAGTVLDASIALGGSGAYPAMLFREAYNGITGNTERMDPNDPMFGSAILTEGLREGIGDNETLQKVIPNEGLRDFLTGTGLSMAENIARLPMGYLGLGVAAGGSGLSGTRDALQRGAGNGQAIALGASNAAAEALFEKFSLEGLDALKVKPGRGTREFLKNIGKQAITEGSEEMATEIANTMADAFIMQDKSQYNKSVAYHMQQGMNEDAAKRQATMDIVQNVLVSGAGGALSGGVMGGGSQALGRFQEGLTLNAYGSTINPDYRDYAQGLDTNRESYANEADYQEAVDLQQLAEEYAARQRQGEFVSNADKARYDMRLREWMARRQEQAAAEQMAQAEARKQQEEEPRAEAQAQQQAREPQAEEPQEVPPREAEESQGPGEAPAPDAWTARTGEMPGMETVEEATETIKMGQESPQNIRESAGAAQVEPVNLGRSQAEAYAKPYGKNGQEVLMSSYDGSIDVNTYSRAFGRAYDAGYQNISMDTAQESAVMAVLTEEQALAAYKAGAQDYNMDHNVRLPQMAQGTPKTGGLGTVAETATQAQRKVAEHVGKMTGLTINIIEGDGGNVRASYGRGQITLSADSDNMLGDLSHELTHFIREYSPSAYEAYTSIVSEAEMKATGRSWENLVEDYINDYADAGQELTRQQAIEELVSDAAEKFLNDEEFINSVVKKDRNLAQRIVDFLTDVIDAIKELIRKGSSTAAAQNLEEDLKLYEEARDTWMYGLDKAGEARTEGWEPAGQGKARTETQGEAQAEGQKGERKALAHPEQVTEQTIEENYQAVRDMDPVTDLTGEEFPRGEKKLSEMVLDFFDSIGNKAHNPVVGDVLLDSRAVKDDMNHGVNHTKAVAFAAIPDVISQGKVLDHQRNWKGRGYDSATLGAKIRIGGEDFYELVVVKLRDKNRLYVHAVYTARMGGPLSLNQVFPVATAGGTGTSGNGPAPSESKTAVAPAARRPAGSSTANLGSGSLPVSSIFERLLNVKGGEETRYKIAGKRIEETDNKDLVAIHNLSEEKLMESLELGGFPMPSIAVTRASEGHDNFGDISVVFRKDTIDPKINRANRVFSADAYTPRFPKTEYKLNETELSGLAARVGMSEASLESNVFDGGDKGQMIDKMKGRNEVREAFLKERGIPIEPVLHQPSISGRHASKGARDFLSREDIDFHSVVYDPSVREEYLDALFANSKWSEAAIKRRRDKVNEQLEGYKDNAAEYGRAEASFQQDQEIARGTAEPVKDASSHTEGVSNAIEAHASEFEEYARGLVEPILGEKYIRNNKDRFNSRGEQRSFNELHDEYTLDNIVRVMAENGMRNAESALTSGTGNVSAALSREFPDIEAIRKGKGRIRNLTEEEYKQVYGKADRLLDEVARYLAGVRGDTGYMALDRAIECLTEAFGSKKTEKGIRSFLEKEYGYTGIPDTTMKQIMDLREYMLAIPVRYFEAKPGRAVGLDEIAAVVLPLNAGEELKNSLAADGVKTVLYDPALPNARREAVSSLENVRFKLGESEDTSETDLDILIQESQPLKEANEWLKNQFETSPKAVEEADIEKITRNLLKEYSSQYSEEKLHDQITRLYKYIQSSAKVNADEAARVAAEIGRGILKQSSRIDTDFEEQYRGLRRQLWETKIELSEADKEDLKAVGGYNAFRKKYFGKIKMGQGGISVDSLYQELNEQHPELFPADYTHPADQLMAIANAIDQTGGQVENPYHANIDEMAVLVGQQILEGYTGNVEARYKAAYQRKIQEYKGQLEEKYEKQIRDAMVDAANERIKIKNALEQAEQARDEAKAAGRTAEREAQEKEIRELKERYRDVNRQAKQIKYVLQPDKYVESMRQMRENRNRSKDRNLIVRDVMAMQNWLLKPDNKKHVPDGVKGIVLEFLHSIDYSTEYTNQKGEPTQRTRAWDDLQRFYEAVQNGGEWTDQVSKETAYFDCDPDLLERIKELKSKVYDIKSLDELSAYEMENMQKVVSSMKKTIMEMNELKANKRAETVGALAEEAIRQLSESYRDDKKPKEFQGRKEYGKVVGAADQLVNYDNITPYTMFWKMGDAMLSVYQSFRGASDQKTVMLKEAQDYIETTLKETGVTRKELKDWTGIKAKEQTFKVQGGIIKLTPAKIMALYAENKRGQARGHIYKDGIKPAPTLQARKGKGGIPLPSKVSKSFNPVQVTPADVEAITSTLSEKQKQLADRMQEFLSTDAAEWGNRASVEMYGYKKFMARDYFPIVTDKNYVQSKEGDLGNELKTTIRNLGMTKSVVPGASNAVIIEDIFDVFTRHVDHMSTYSAFLAPLSDFNKIYNYRNRQNAVSVKQEIERAEGKAGQEYIETLIRDINGQTTNTRNVMDALLSRWKGSAVSWSLSVTVQQPSSYLRALAEMHGGDLAKGAAARPEKGQWELICKYAPIAQWKDWGFYQMNTSRSMKGIMFGTDDTVANRVTNFGMKGAEAADRFTWNRIWNACEIEVKRDHTNLQEGTEEFYKKVGERFSEIIDKTQVVDSVLHRSQIMRKRDMYHKIVTSFMGEPTNTYNMLYRAAVDVKQGNKGGKGRAARAAAAFALSSALGAALYGIVGALRDDEDKKFLEKWKTASISKMIESVNPLSLVPIAKDVVSIWQGYTPARSDMQGFQDIMYAVKRIEKLIEGESQYTPQEVAVYAIRQTSGLFGIPADNIIREMEGLANTLTQATGKLADNYRVARFKYDIGYSSNRSRYATMIAEAEEMGNQELASQIREDMLQAGSTAEEIERSVTSVITKQYKEDEKVQAAAEAKASGDLVKYGELYGELEAEGYRGKQLKSAIQSLADKMSDETETTVAAENSNTAEAEEEDSKDETEKKESRYSSGDLVTAIEQYSDTKESLQAFETVAQDMYQTKIDNGMDSDKARSSIRSSITREYKDRWIEAYNAGNKAEYEEIQRKLKQLKIDGKYLYDGSDWTAWKKEAKEKK